MGLLKKGEHRLDKTRTHKQYFKPFNPNVWEEAQIKLWIQKRINRGC